MTAPLDEKRLAELRVAAEIGVRMSALHPHTVHVRPSELAALVTEVFAARAQERPHAGVACRTCGCTDNDCSGCVERTGAPCYWVEPDLCSACSGAPRVPMAQAIARNALARYAAPGALAVVLDERGGLALGLAAVDHPIVNPLLALAEYLHRAIGEIAARTGVTTEGVGPPAPRPSDRAACIHCREDVCAAEDVAAIREHSMTCSASPVVQELRRLRELLHERERTVEVSSRLLVDQRDAARGELAERSPTRPSRLLSNEEKRVVVDALHAAAAYARRTRSHALDGKTFVVDSDLSEHVDALARRAGTCDRLAAELHGYEVRLEKAPS